MTNVMAVSYTHLRAHDSATQLTHGIDRSEFRRLVPLVQLGMDTLDDDDRIIDHNSDGKHHSTKSQQVDTKSDQG